MMENNNYNRYYSLNLGTIEIKQSKQSFYRVRHKLKAIINFI